MKKQLFHTFSHICFWSVNCWSIFRIVGALLFLGAVTSVRGANNVVYTDAHVRITLISDGVVRLEYMPDGNFVNDASFICVNRVYPEVKYKSVSKKTGLK